MRDDIIHDMLKHIICSYTYIRERTSSTRMNLSLNNDLGLSMFQT